MDKEFLKSLIERLKEKKLKISFAESITAGLATSELANIPGISAVLLGGIITYRRESKEDILKVSPWLIDKLTAESAEVTNAMALGLRDLFKADINIAVTGAASEPSNGSDYQLTVPVGTVFISILYKDEIHEFREKFDGGPDEIRQKAVNEIYLKLNDLIN